MASTSVLLGPVEEVVRAFAGFGTLSGAGFYGRMSKTGGLFSMGSRSVSSVRTRLGNGAGRRIVRVFCSYFTGGSCKGRFLGC